MRHVSHIALYKRIKGDPALIGIPFPGKTLLCLDDPAKVVRCNQLQQTGGSWATVIRALAEYLLALVGIFCECRTQ